MASLVAGKTTDGATYDDLRKTASPRAADLDKTLQSDEDEPRAAIAGVRWWGLGNGRRSVGPACESHSFRFAITVILILAVFPPPQTGPSFLPHLRSHCSSYLS